MRRSTFKCDASGVQGNEGATVTFKPVTVGGRREYLKNAAITDAILLAKHVISWEGIVDDGDNPLPSPEDQPDVVDEIYLHERDALLRLLFNGPDVPKKKN